VDDDRPAALAETGRRTKPCSREISGQGRRCPPCNEETARQKVRAAQDAWNPRDPEKVSLAYTEDSKWRNREEFFEGREEIDESERRIF